MKRVVKLTLFVGAMVFLAVPTLSSVYAPKAAAADKNSNKKPDTSQKSTSKPSENYSYTAQPGDSYTLMARKSVQTYAQKNKVKITEAGIIFAETNLTKAAGSPHLTVGQKVEINGASVKDWADKGAALNPQQQAAWNYYAQFADFNTAGVGQAK